jgi:hypothetical protein
LVEKLSPEIDRDSFDAKDILLSRNQCAYLWLFTHKIAARFRAIEAAAISVTRRETPPVSSSGTMLIFAGRESTLLASKALF